MPTVTLNLPETTFVSSAQASNNFLFYPLMYVGTDPSYQDCTSLINVALPTLPKRVDSAFLQLSVIVKSGAAPSTVAVSQLGAAFDAKTVTYSSMPALISTATAFNVSASDLYTSIQADVTDIVNAWLSGAAANNGIALTNSDGTIIQFGTNNIVYAPYFPKLIIRYSDTPVPTEQPYGYIYNTDGQSVDQERAIQFTSNGPMEQMTHRAGSSSVVIESAGLYAVWYRVTGTGANQFAVFQNSGVILSSVYGTTLANNTGTAMVNAAQGDRITLRNHTSSGSVTLNNTAGGSAPGVSASLTILRIGPNVAPEPSLADVNAAETNDEMLSAISNPALGLNLTGYNSLTADQQQFVLAGLLSQRPTLGYLTVPDVQAMLDYEVTLVPYEPDPNNIYVKAGATGGNGSIALPFGDIQMGIDAVNPGGTVHILSGTYRIASTISIEKSNITLAGVPGASIVDMNDIPSIGCWAFADGITLNNLTLVRSVGGIFTMLLLAANDCLLTNNTFSGNPAASITAIDFSMNQGNNLISLNKIHDVTTGIRLQPDERCAVTNNNIYNTYDGILVQTTLAQIESNFWTGGSGNVFDIILDSSVAGSYDQAALSAQNNGANIGVQ